MSVKELLTDSWNNMLKNNFILKCFLVALAAFLISILFVIVMVIPYYINPILGLVVTVLGIVFYIPVSIASSKVLLDVFQGRDAKVLGFVPYGFKNAKKMWAIIGRTILKLLPLYLIKFVLLGILIAYIFSSVASIYKDVVSGEKTTVYSSETVAALTSDAVESLTPATDSFDDSIEDSLDDTLSEYDFSNYDLEDFNSLTDKYSSSDYLTDGYTSSNYLDSSATTSSEEINALLNALNSNEFKEAFSKFMDQYGDQIAKFFGVFVLYLIVSLILDILIIMKKLYYTVSYYLAFEDDNVTSREAIEQSEELMKGNRAKYFWTMVLIMIVYGIASSIIQAIPALVAAALLSLILAFLYYVYLESYQFTFFTKLVGNGSSNVASTGTYVSETPVVETPVSEPTVVEQPEEKTETDSTEE